MARSSNEWGKIFLGMLLLLGLHILWVLISILVPPFNTNYLFVLMWIYIGIWQYLYAIPVALWLRHKRQIALMKGVVIGAILTSLLNGSCFLLFHLAR